MVPPWGGGGGVSVWYGVCLIQLVSLCFQLPLFWAIVSAIHLPFFSIQPCKWSPHTRQMCCRPEFPTNYRLEIRTVRVIRASSAVICLLRSHNRGHPLAERTDLGSRYLFAWMWGYCKHREFWNTCGKKKKFSFYSRNSKVTLRGSSNTGTRLGQTTKGIFTELTPWCSRIWIRGSLEMTKD